MNSTFLWYTTRATGIVSLILLTLTMVLGLVTTGRARARNWPGFAQQEIHRRISILAVVFLAIHVVTSILDTYVHIGWFAIVVPFTSPYSRFWVGLGTIALDLMVAVFVSSLLRAHLKPGTWRGIHWLAYASLADRPGPHVRHGHRFEGALGHRTRRSLRALGRRCADLAIASRCETKRECSRAGTSHVVPPTRRVTTATTRGAEMTHNASPAPPRTECTSFWGIRAT